MNFSSWVLTLFFLTPGQPTETVEYAYATRIACFDAMAAHVAEAKKYRTLKVSGLCSKYFDDEHPRQPGIDELPIYKEKRRG